MTHSPDRERIISLVAGVQAISEQLQRLNEIEHRVLQKQDEQLIKSNDLHSGLRSIATAAGAINEQLQPLQRLDEIERRVLQKQDEQLIKNNDLHSALRAVVANAAVISEQLQPLQRLDEIERRILQKQDEQLVGNNGLRSDLRRIIADSIVQKQDEQPVENNSLRSDLGGIIATAGALSEQLQPLQRLDEIERRILQKQDEQLIENSGIHSDLRRIATIAGAISEQLQPLQRLDEIEGRILQKQDAQLAENNDLHSGLRAIAAIAGAIGEQLRPLQRLDEIERRILQKQDELDQNLANFAATQEIRLHKIDQLETAIEAGESAAYRKLTEHFDTEQSKVLAQLTTTNVRLQDAISGWKTAEKDFALNVRLHDRHLRTTLALQEQLAAGPLAFSSGPAELPQIKQIMADKETNAAQALISDKYVEFLDQKVYFDDLISLYVVFKEIFLYEDYFVDLDTPAPRIIDAGAHIGLATVYLKHLYPEATIICFEPDPRNFELLERNTKHFGKSVIRNRKAVTPDGKKVQLLRRQGMSMASSIYERTSQITDQDRITAAATKLSPFLAEPVDLLKIDIEGPEDLVLEECRDRIHNVHYLFIEFHTGNNLPIARLKTILDILDKAGFTYQIERAREYQARMMHRPFTHLDTTCTHVVHAKNLSWHPEGAPGA